MKDFFYFSPRERQGFVILIVLIGGIFLGKFLFGREPQIEPAATLETLVSEQRVQSDSLGSLVRKTENPMFNPETTQHPSQAISKPATKPIVKQEEKRTYYQNQKTQTEQASQKAGEAQKKLSPGTQIELNSADSSLLCQVPGIGPSYAKRIIGYRNLLGGYHKHEQLQEVYGMYVELYEKIIPYFQITTDSLRLISINSASLDKMRAHPYLNFYQAKAIVDIRKKKGKLTNFEELRLLEEFTEDDWLRILPYLEFN